MKSTTTFHVDGMHCQACELLLEKKLGAVPGVAGVKASLRDNTIEVTVSDHNKLPSPEKLTSAVHEYGYTVMDESVGNVSWNAATGMKAGVIAVVFILSYLILQDTNLMGSITLDRTSSIATFFVFGIIAGLSTCAALVGGLLLSLSRQWSQMYGGVHEGKRYIPFAMFNIGRIVSFGVLGAALGALGSVFQLTLESTAVLVILVSLLMVVLALQMLGIPWFRNFRLQIPRFASRYISDEGNFAGKYMPFIAGALTFFVPCGFTLMAQTVALATGNPFTSGLMMVAFAFGTLPVLAGISFSSLKLQHNPTFASTFNLVVGMLLLIFGLYSVNTQMNVLGLPNTSDVVRAITSPAETEQAVEVSGLDADGLGVQLVGSGETQYQQVYMKASGFEYFPKTLTLKAGVPTKVSIQNQDVIGCAQAMYMKGLHQGIVYLNTPQANVEFIPQPGNYKISCTMGMVEPVLVTVK